MEYYLSDPSFPLVDLHDFTEFAMCLTGAGGGLPLGCEAADTNGDGDVDMFDVAAVQNIFTGDGP